MPAEFTTLKYLLFDLDNTLYPASSGLSVVMEERMSNWVCRYLGLEPGEGSRLRRDGYLRYGTTLQWLLREKGLADPADFLEDVHPHNVADWLPVRPELRSMLESIPLPKAVLTNSPASHARRVLARLGLEDCFNHLFDLGFNAWCGKPAASAYQRALAVMGCEAGDVLFIDDVPAYLDGFAALGGRCLLVDEDGSSQGHAYPVIRRIDELPAFLASLP